MGGWHHRLNGHEFEQAPGVGDGQGSLACCSPWDGKESGVTERLTLSFRDITLPATIRLVKAMVFPVGIYGYDIWTIK